MAVFWGFNGTYRGPKQSCSAHTPLLVLGFMEEFHVQAGPYRAAGGAGAELGYCSALQKVLAPNLELSAPGKRLPGASC